MSSISETEKKHRQRINESVVGTHAMEGLDLDSRTRKLLTSYEVGDITEEQLSQSLHRHAMELAISAASVAKVA